MASGLSSSTDEGLTASPARTSRPAGITSSKERNRGRLGRRVMALPVQAVGGLSEPGGTSGGGVGLEDSAHATNNSWSLLPRHPWKDPSLPGRLTILGVKSVFCQVRFGRSPFRYR